MFFFTFRMSSLGLFSAMVDALATKRKPGTDLTLSIMKSLSYLDPISGKSLDGDCF